DSEVRSNALKAARTEVGDVMRDFGRAWDADFTSKIIDQVGMSFDKVMDKARSRLAMSVVTRSLRLVLKGGGIPGPADWNAAQTAATDAIQPSMKSDAAVLVAEIFTDDVMRKICEGLGKELAAEMAAKASAK
ncbi:MAG: hypothetical protein O2877_02590, partial [bacterium]|nr:hypothetical protein [bacterium]